MSKRKAKKHRHKWWVCHEGETQSGNPFEQAICEGCNKSRHRVWHLNLKGEVEVNTSYYHLRPKKEPDAEEPYWWDHYKTVIENHGKPEEKRPVVRTVTASVKPLDLRDWRRTFGCGGPAPVQSET